MDSEGRCREHTPESLMAYLYEECEPDEQELMEAHLATCRSCAAEIEALRSVRGSLDMWTPPGAALGFRIVSDGDGGVPQAHGWRWLREPSWGLAAAATVVLVVGAALASVEVRYDADGFAFRMGWSGRPSVDAPNAPETRQAGNRLPSAGVVDPALETVVDTAVPPGPVPVEARTEPPGEPWSADLAALESQIRTEMLQRVADLGRSGNTQPVGATQPGDDTYLLERVQGLITDSERRQQQELALWFTQFAQEFDMQRRADQQRVQEELGALEGVADYLVRVSSQR